MWINRVITLGMFRLFVCLFVCFYFVIAREHQGDREGNAQSSLWDM